MSDCTYTNTLTARSARVSLATLFRNWRTRNKVRNMMELDDRMLRDIGVNRDEVIRASNLPLKVNSALELEAAARRRRSRNRYR